MTGIEYCLENQTDFILRIKNKAFNLYNEKGEVIELSSMLKDVTEQSCDFILYYKYKNKLKPIRFCAVRKSREEIEIEKKHILQKESKKGECKIKCVSRENKKSAYALSFFSEV